MKVRILKNPSYKHKRTTKPRKAPKAGKKKLPAALRAHIARTKAYAKSHGLTYGQALKRNKGKKPAGKKAAKKGKMTVKRKNPGMKKVKRTAKGVFIMPKNLKETAYGVGGAVIGGGANLGLGLGYNALTKEHAGKTWHGYGRFGVQVPIPVIAAIIAGKAKKRGTKMAFAGGSILSGVVAVVSGFNAVRQHLKNRKRGGALSVSGIATWAASSLGNPDNSLYIEDEGSIVEVASPVEKMKYSALSSMGFGVMA